MLKITMYKNCILNKNYQEVFAPAKDSNVLILEKYLNTLVKRTFNIENVYYENTGTLVFDFDSNTLRYRTIYDFNYLKIEEFDDIDLTERLIRYCFIDKIEVKNEIVYLTYSEDIWHSYIENLEGIRRSFLTNSRFHDYNYLNTDYRKLPIEYDGNDMLKILVDKDRVLVNVNVYAQIQLKKLDSQGNPTNSFMSYIIRLQHLRIDNVNLVHVTTQSPDFYECEFTNTIMQDYIKTYEFGWDINYLLLNQSYGKACWSDEHFYTPESFVTMNEWSYEIGKIWIVPEEWKVEEDLDHSENNGFIIFNVGDAKAGDTILVGKIVNYRRGEQYLFKTYTIENDYTNLYCGTFKTHFEFNNNGTDLTLELRSYVDPYNFQIMLNAEGNILDITNDFEVDIPFTALNAETTKQNAIARYLNNENLNYKQFQNAIKFTKQTNLSAMKFMNSFGSAKDGGGIGALGGMLGAVVNQGIAIADVIGTANHFGNMKEYANARTYSTVKAVDVNNATVINGIYGLLIFRMTLDNEDFVREYINNMGYLVYNFINSDDDILELKNISSFKNICNYNVLKFESCHIYGGFTNEIAENINNIFINGVKIWYDYTLTEDEYDI